MKRKRIAILAVIAVLGITLTGCTDGDNAYEKREQRIDRLYSECLEAGGDWEYNATLPYWACTNTNSNTKPEEAPK